MNSIRANYRDDQTASAHTHNYDLNGAQMEATNNATGCVSASIAKCGHANRQVKVSRSIARLHRVARHSGRSTESSWLAHWRHRSLIRLDRSGGRCLSRTRNTIERHTDQCKSAKHSDWRVRFCHSSVAWRLERTHNAHMVIHCNEARTSLV